MLDIRFIRENPEKVRDGCTKKQVKVDINQLLEVDKKRRESLQAIEDMLAQKNKASKQIAVVKDETERQKIILEMQELDKNSDRLHQELKSVEEEFNNLMYQVPNLPLDDVPVGKNDKENIVLREVGEKPKFDCQPKDYMEIAKNLDLIDTERAGKVSGTRFGYLKREAVLLEFALVNLVFEVLRKEKFMPIVPPVMIKPEMMKAMGYVERGGRRNLLFGER